MTYVLNHPNEYNLEKVATEMSMDYKVLMIDKQIDLQHVARAINQPLDLLKKYNPAYKKNLINGSVEAPKRLLLPHDEELMNDSLLYIALHSPISSPEQASGDVDRYGNLTHQVSQGETVAAIAERYGISVSELRSWNALTSKSSINGRNLIVSKPENSRLASKPTLASKKISYVVKKGDTLSGIASRHKGATVAKIKADNKLSNSKLKIGQKLIITNK